MTKKRLITLFVIAQMLDLVTTVVMVGFLGFIEINPVTAGVSLTTFAVVKIVLIALSAWVLLYLPLPRWFYYLACVLSAIPGVWNLMMLSVEWVYGIA